ncbi:unnamed protein product [Rotaria sp. Silwood1]|nr:unnamed protein product [Rotaria sp. Silwood1]
MQNIIVLLVLALAIFATTGSKVEEKASDGGIFHVKVRTSNFGRIKYEDGEVLLAQNLEKPTDIFFTPFPRVDPSSTECQENELSGQTELILSVDLYTSHLIRDVHAYINKRYPTLCNGDVEENMTTKCDVSLLPMNAIRLVQKGLRSNMSRLKYLVDDQWHSNTLLLQSVQFIIYTHNISVCHQARSATVDRCQMSNFEIQYSLYSEKIVERQIEITSEHVTSSSMFNHIRSQLPTTDIVALTGNDFKQLLNEVTDRVQLEKADDRLWDSLYWTKEQMRPDRLSKVLNIVFRKESNDSDHFVYDSNAAKNSQKLHLTQHDIDQFEKLDKFLSTYSRTSSTLGSQHGQGQGSVSFGIGPYRFGGGGGGSHQSHSQNSQSNQGTLDTTNVNNTGQNHLNITRIEGKNDTKYVLSRSVVDSSLAEHFDHVYLEGDIVRPKSIDVHLIKQSSLRMETKLLSHIALVRMRSDVHVLPLRCPIHKKDANKMINHSRLEERVDQLVKIVEKLSNQLGNTSSNMETSFSIRMNQLEEKMKNNDSEIIRRIEAIERNMNQEHDRVFNGLETIQMNVSQEVQRLEAIQVNISQQYEQLSNRIKCLESKSCHLKNLTEGM